MSGGTGVTTGRRFQGAARKYQKPKLGRPCCTPPPGSRPPPDLSSAFQGCSFRSVFHFCGIRAGSRHFYIDAGVRGILFSIKGKVLFIGMFLSEAIVSWQKSFLRAITGENFPFLSKCYARTFLSRHYLNVTFTFNSL